MMQKLVVLVSVAIVSSGVLAETNAHDPKLMKQQGHIAAVKQGAPLTEAGNDLFGTVQEVIRQLESRPDIEWESVDLEALRQHLLDMRDMSENVEVLNQTAIENGSLINLTAVTPRAHNALRRVFAAHPAQLKLETGWEMQVTEENGTFTLVTISSNPTEANKIRGLGYIGLMAWGNHHQPHHWAMATGQNPHTGH